MSDCVGRTGTCALIRQIGTALDSSKSYDAIGILWTKRVGEASETAEHWALRGITNCRHAVYVRVGRIAYEYMHSSSKTERRVDDIRARCVVLSCSSRLDPFFVFIFQYVFAYILRLVIAGVGHIVLAIPQRPSELVDGLATVIACCAFPQA